ncbi:Lar family restriction alleviation protein [Phytobacter diazotrophicus]
MSGSTYEVTFIANYPDGDRYPLKYEVDASGVEQAIELATAKAAPLRIGKENLTIKSVVPYLCPLASETINHDGLLKPCPFCGNLHVSLVETLREFDGENTWFVNCGSCNASQLPDSKEGAIRNWNQRNAPEVCRGE